MPLRVPTHTLPAYSHSPKSVHELTQQVPDGATTLFKALVIFSLTLDLGENKASSPPHPPSPPPRTPYLYRPPDPSYRPGLLETRSVGAFALHVCIH